MKAKHNKPILQKTLRMKENHTWKAPKGYKIFVMDRGAVSFNIPASWHLAKLEPNVEFNDQPPPDDEARLSVSYWRFPPDIDWTGLPLAPLLAQSISGSEMQVLERSEIIRLPRTDLEIVWTQHRFLDPVEKRDAFSRFALARGFGIHVFISCDFWVEDAPRIQPVWNEALRSLQLGRVIEDPTRGPVEH